ncbi:MAG: dehydrogenase [Rhodospirillaceae bacterium]|nr:dehydrogenase [Rhodospirillaceae bacterium]
MNSDQYGKGLDPSVILGLFRRMQRTRLAEERVRQICLKGGVIKCSPHLYHGQEAVAAGVCANLSKNDYLFSTHRSHGHYLAANGDLGKFFAELFGKKSGCSAGKGGSMHLIDKDVGYLGSSPIVGGSAPLAVGSALGIKHQKKNNVVVSFLGDGALEEGSTYESFNFAAVKNLPVLFVVENNGYAIFSHLETRQKYNNAYKRYEDLGVPGLRVDGNNVLKVYNKANEIITKLRSGGGPFLLECMTYRVLGHAGPHPDHQAGYRTKEEVDSWVEKCPIKNLEAYMDDKNIINQKQKQSLNDELNEQINDAVEFATNSPLPDVEDLLSDVMATGRISL